MATVTSIERRILRDYFGYDDPMIDSLPESIALHHLSAYHSQQETGFYDTAGGYTGPTIEEAESGWIGEGLRKTAQDIGGKGGLLDLPAVIGLWAQVIKYGIPIALAVAGYVVYLRYK